MEQAPKRDTLGGRRRLSCSPVCLSEKLPALPCAPGQAKHCVLCCLCVLKEVSSSVHVRAQQGQRLQQSQNLAPSCCHPPPSKAACRATMHYTLFSTHSLMHATATAAANTIHDSMSIREGSTAEGQTQTAAADALEANRQAAPAAIAAAVAAAVTAGRIPTVSVTRLLQSLSWCSSTPPPLQHKPSPHTTVTTTHHYHTSLSSKKRGVCSTQLPAPVTCMLAAAAAAAAASKLACCC